MFDKLQAAKDKYDEITHKLSDPAVIENQEEYRRLMKEHSELEELVAKYDEYLKVSKEIEDAKELLNEKLDKDFEEMVLAELQESKEKLEKIKKELKILLNLNIF